LIHPHPSLFSFTNILVTRFFHPIISLCQAIRLGRHANSWIMKWITTYRNWFLGNLDGHKNKTDKFPCTWHHEKFTLKLSFEKQLTEK
jgi:hypothetical protein